MSNIRRTRSEIKQSLHQHMMHFYQSYRETCSKERARELVTQAIHEELARFGEDPKQMTERAVLEQIEKRFSSYAHKDDYDKQAFIQDTVLTINELKKALAQEEEILREPKTR